MKRGHKRVISFITTALLISSTVFAYPLSIKASTSKSGIDNETKISIAKSLFAKEAKMAGTKGKLNYTNDNSSKTNTTSLNPDDDVRLIVQLNEKCVKDYLPGVQLSKAGFSSSLKQTVLDSQGTVKTQVLRLSKNIKIRDTYYLLLNGFSVQAKARDISKIENLSGVKHVTVCRQFYPDMNYSKNLTNVPEVWNDTNLKYKGEGQVIAIIDTGIDMNHKDMKITDTSKEKLKPEKGFNDKVPYGYNFADNNTEVKAAPGTSEHGMHVAGIVAANGSDAEIAKNLAVKGNAPEAQLLAEKVFSNNPNFESAFSDDIVAAIEDSVAHKADVINMSLGSAEAFQDSESAEQIAVKNANDSGTVCCISAGNDQYSLAPYKFGDLMDDGTVGSPGIAEASLCVASYENTNITSYGIDYSSSDGQGSNPLLYTMCNVNPLDTLNDTSNGYELVYAGLGTADDFTNAGDLTGKIALVQRGSNTFVEKQENAQAANAIGIIVFDKDSNVNQPLSNMATDPSVKIPALFISTTDGYTLKDLISKNLKVYFKGSVATIANSASGNMSDFTSWGPTPNLEIKPEVTAPGGNIWSTVNNNRYESMSGTSMASPHTAGIVALVSQHMADFQKNNNVTLTAKDRANLEKALVINTAVPKLDPATKGTNYFSPRRQGAGLVDAYAAVKNNVTIKGEDGKSVVALKEINTASKQFKLSFHNYGTTDVTYNCKDLSGVMQEQNKPALTTMSYDVPISGSGVTFSNSTITVPAGKDAELTVTLSLPSASTNNYVEGYLSFVDPTNTVPTIGTTYMGYYGKWDASTIIDAPAWDSDNTYLGYTSLYTEDSGDVGYLGVDGYYKSGDPVINPDKIAFSTNKKAINTNTVPGLTFLRNSKSSTFEILDSKQNVVRTLNITENIRKDTLSEDLPARLMSDWEWDGKVYDTATNSYVAAKDGQYYIRVTSSIDYPNAEPQSIVMPVKLDSVAPTISDITYSDGKVSFKAADENSGFAKIAYFVDDAEEPVILSVYKDKSGNSLGYDKETGLYSFMLDSPLSGVGQHEIDIIGLDNAGNLSDVGSVNHTVTGSNMVISIDSKYATGSIFNTDKINFTGSLTEVPAEFKVMGNDAMKYFDKDTLKFSVPVTLKEGLNKVSIYAKGNPDTDYQNYSVNIYSDTVAPTITLTSPSVVKDTLTGNTITADTDADTYTIAGTVKDDLFGYKLSLNGDVITNVNLEVPDENATLRTFEKKVSLRPGPNTFVLTAEDIAGNQTTVNIKINALGYKRLGGPSRVDTALQISNDGWESSDYAVLVSGNNFPDGIVAGPLAKAYNAPILLTRATAGSPSLESSVLNELTRLKVKHVLIIGGAGVVPTGVENDLKTAKIDYNRIGGQTRYETCSMVADYMVTNKFASGKKVVVVNANAYADALSISAYAAENAYPILLVDNNSINKTISDFLKNNSVTDSLAIGGKGVISDTVVNSLPKCTRISGNDRYDTNVQVLSKLATDNQLSTVYLATGESFADALTASALAAKNNSQIVLVSPQPASVTKQYIQSKSSVINKYVVIGGTGVVDNNIISLLLNK